MKQIVVTLPPDLHKQFKIESVMQDKSMTEITANLIRSYLAQQAKERAKLPM